MTESLDDLLRRSARVQDQDLRATRLVDSLDAAWREARAEAGAAATAVPRRPRARGRVAAAAAALIVVAGGAARAGDAGPLERERRINCDWQFR